MSRRSVMNAADDGQASALAREPREMLGDFHSSDPGADRPERAADVDRRVGLGVPGVDVAHAAPGEEDDARFGFAETAGAGAGQSGVLEGEPGGKRETSGAEPKEVSPRQEGIHAHQVPSSPMASPAPALLMRVSYLCYATRLGGGSR